MSFENGPSTEAQTGGASFGAFGSFASLTGTITDNLYDLSSNLKAIRRLLVKVQAGGSKAHDMEIRLGSLTEETLSKFRTVGGYVRSMDAIDSNSLNATQRITKDKLNHEFKTMLNDFKKLQKDAALRERARIDAAKSYIDLEEAEARGEHTEHTETTPLIQGQQQQQLQQEQQQQLLDVANQEDIDFQNSLIREREEEIQTIERGITEINSIFRDLGTLVTEQGEQVDVIEENVSNLASNTHSASAQLKKANEYQKMRKKWSCCILTVLIVVLLIIVLLILV